MNKRLKPVRRSRPFFVTVSRQPLFVTGFQAIAMGFLFRPFFVTVEIISNRKYLTLRLLSIAKMRTTPAQIQRFKPHGTTNHRASYLVRRSRPVFVTQSRH
jgi:hypothetical protein